LEGTGKLDKNFKTEEHLRRLEADVAEPEPALKFNARSFLEAGWRAAVAVVVVGLVFLAASTFHWKDATAAKMLVALASGLVAYVLAALAKTVQSRDLQVTHKQLQDPDQFARNFEQLIRDGVKARRIVIAIDNLDRCSPERVTELLATIKTFLEPVQTGKELVFLIAADDAALRRHLIAQELAASGGKNSSGESSTVQDESGEATQAPDQPSSRRAPKEVQDAVEEYLRKFFNGTLRLTEVLDEDIRDFAEAKLKKFVAARKMSNKDASQLVELVATALKQNPRRIKQFINGLELRLKLLEQRKEGGRIQIDPNVLVVAKLAVIEEESQDRFQELRGNPRLLAEWHEEARSGQEDHEDEAFSQWQVFLRNTEEIQADDLRPYLALKQSRRELQLPRYQEFADALEDTRIDALEQLLEDPDVVGKRDEYIEAIPEHLQAVIRRGYRNAAANIVRSAIESPSLQAHASAVLVEAMRHWPLRDRLAQLPPVALVTAASDLEDVQFNSAVGLLLKRFEQTGEGTAEGRASISEALAPVLDRFDERRRVQLSKALERGEIAKDFAATVILAKQDPALIPDEALNAALESLGSDERLAEDTPAYKVATDVLVRRDEPSYAQVQKFGEAVAKALLAYATDEEGTDAFASLAKDASAVIRRFDIPRTSFQEPVEQLNEQWPQIAQPLHPPTMDFVAALLDAGTDDAREQFATSVAERFFTEEPAAAIEWAEGRQGDFGRALTSAIHERLAVLVSGEGDDSALHDRATDLAETLDSQSGSSIIARGVRLAIQGGHYMRAAALIERFRNLLADERDALIGEILHVSENDPAADQPQALNAVASLAPSDLSDDLRGRQGEIVAQAALHEHERWRETYNTLVSDSAFEAQAGEIVSKVFNHVSAQGNDLRTHEELVDFVADEKDRLEEGKVRQLGTLIVEALKQWPSGYPPKPMAPVAASVGKLDTVDAGLRQNWVTDLIAVEHQQSDDGTREALLQAAVALAGNKNSNAWKEVKARLKDLKKDGTEAQKAMA
jgi:hypothetical protein